MLTHPMLDQLTQLGLSGMAQAFAELEASGEGATLIHADWLGLLVDREVTFCHGPRLVNPLSHDPVAGVLLLSGVGAWPPPDGVG